MFRFNLIVVLSCLSLVGCGGNKANNDSGDDASVVLPQSGDWSVVTTGFSDDDCNAEDFLIPFNEVTIADLATSSFSITYFLDNTRIGDGSSNCSNTSANDFDCDEISHTTMFSNNADATMTALGKISVISETSISGVGELVLDCVGIGCGAMEGITATGTLPCNTTLNWTASAN